MTPRTPAERTLAAECRAVEAGHHARRAGDGRHFIVRGEDHSDNTYYVRVIGVGDVTVFSCDHPVVLGFADKPERSFVPCRHGATVARRLEREGLLRWNGAAWVATEKANRLAGHDPDADPFDGLPS